MILTATPNKNDLAALAARLEQRGFTRLEDEAAFDAFTAEGSALVLFVEDPVRVPEAWDLAVIVPEVCKPLGAAVRTGFVLPVVGKQLQPRFGFRVWPALLCLRGGGYVGALEGIRDWATYSAEVPALLARPVTRGLSLPMAAPASPSPAGCG